MSVSYQSARQVPALLGIIEAFWHMGLDMISAQSLSNSCLVLPPQTSEFSFILGQQLSGPWFLAPWCCKSTGSA
jgi:hypothetical protein